MQEKILILDFGSQYTQLIARRVRELNIYCEIHPYNKIPELTDNLKGVYLSNFFLKLFYLLLIIYFIKKEDDGYLVNFFFSLSSIVVYLFFWIYIFKKEKH